MPDANPGLRPGQSSAVQFDKAPRQAGAGRASPTGLLGKLVVGIAGLNWQRKTIFEGCS
jgi:hypothetical protein